MMERREKTGIDTSPERMHKPHVDAARAHLKGAYNAPACATLLYGT
jgi:hypothetical protein